MLEEPSNPFRVRNAKPKVMFAHRKTQRAREKSIPLVRCHRRLFEWPCKERTTIPIVARGQRNTVCKSGISILQGMLLCPFHCTRSESFGEGGVDAFQKRHDPLLEKRRHLE
ncbi:hypothetical protein TNIN_150811 [Trichonephila inaurata madagascariensis]|uniref:Uncharacterized protein n=1 Tax=Trichonephila inaurata madagascariensis TaxID=2747483 RepID=A0A8X7CEI6_9ARAC|nr:hypothetical protein TNIN_150811 [Trichonephila inaurata madagascariensis]